MDSATKQKDDPVSGGPVNRIDVEAQTYERRNDGWRTFVTVLAFIFACSLHGLFFSLSHFRQARALDSVRADIEEIKQAMYVDHNANADIANVDAKADARDLLLRAGLWADDERDFNVGTRDLLLRYRPDDERDFDFHDMGERDAD